MEDKITRKDIQDIIGTDDNDQYVRVEQNREEATMKKTPLLREPLVIAILGLTAMSNSAYAIIAPFLPFEFKRKGIDETWMGYIFSVYSLAVIFLSP